MYTSAKVRMTSTPQPPAAVVGAISELAAPPAAAYGTGLYCRRASGSQSGGNRILILSQSCAACWLDAAREHSRERIAPPLPIRRRPDRPGAGQ